MPCYRVHMRSVRSGRVVSGDRSLDTIGTDSQAQPTPPGEHLTSLEETMLAQAKTGEWLDCGEGPFDLAAMQSWGKERAVNAAVLRELLVGKRWPVHAKGVRLRGVLIGGLLDLEGAELHCPLSLDGCWLDASDPVCLDRATATRIALTKCHLAGGLTADMLTAGQVDLSRSTLLKGPLSLKCANITGELICSGAQLKGTDSDLNALVAGGIKVGGSVYLDPYLDDKQFTADGAVWLARADIGDDLDCCGAQLGSNSDGIGLLAEGVKVGGHVFLREGFKADGAVRLLGADISGDLSCRAGRLGRDHNGYALVADRMTVGGEVHLYRGFAADGAVVLDGADITGDLSFSGAQLTGTNNDGKALIADGIKVGAAVLLNDGFTAAGIVSFNSARAERLELSPAKRANEIRFDFTAKEAEIAGELRWAPDGQFSGQVNLEDAHVGQLEDNNWPPTGEQASGYWPPGGKLCLNGFTYGGLADASVDQRLEWVSSQYQGAKRTAFAAQPYEQLADWYSRAGQDSEARAVAIARRRDLRKYGNLKWYRKFGNWFLDATIRYGYETWRAAAGLAVVFVAFWVLSWGGAQLHVIVPTGDVKRPAPTATHCTSDYPCFYPFGYTIDTVIPIINVHQADHWGPDGSKPFGLLWVIGVWGATAAGWALATLLVAGYTGLVRQD